MALRGKLETYNRQRGRVYPVSKKGFGQITPAADVQEAIRMQEQTAA